MTLLRTTTLAVLLASAPSLAAQAGAERPGTPDPLSVETLRAQLAALTAESMRGRATGEDGFERAACLVRDHFRAVGLEPASAEGYLLRVPWSRTRLDLGRTVLRIERKGQVVFERCAATGLRVVASADSESSAPLAILRWSGRADELEAIDAAGHAVLVVPPGPLTGTRTCFEIDRALRRGGARLLAVADESLGDGEAERVHSIPRGRAAEGRFRVPPILALGRREAEALAHAVGTALPAAGESVVRCADAAAVVQIRTVSEPAPAFNVAGILRGSDPEVRGEYVLIGCHLDHLGERGGVVYPGADDDASGVVAVMALAEAFARERPRRSVMFVAFCGEERGLIGSTHFAAEPPVPLESIVAVLQLDSIGRSEENDGETAEENRNSLHLIGTRKLSAELHELCVRANAEHTRFDLEWDEEDIFERSDHWSFAREGVPSVFFFGGFHRDYHRPSDTADKIELAKLRRVTELVHAIAARLAGRDERPHVDADKWAALPRKGRASPAAPARR